MPDPEKGDPDKKSLDDWFVGSEESTPAQPAKPPAPPAPRKPEPPSTGKGRLLLPILILLALLVPAGFYFRSLRFDKAKVDEAVTPKPPDEAPPPREPVLPPTPPPVAAKPKPEQKKQALPPAESLEPKAVEPERPEPAPRKVEAPPKPQQPPAPASGIMLWSGKVEKNGTIVIDGAKSATGTVNGAVLPGVPVTVRVEPKGFTVSDPPSEANGWKRIAIHSEKKAHIVVTVFWNRKE